MQTGPDTPAASRPWLLIVAVLIVADVTATFETQMILAALKALYVDLKDPVAVGWLVTTYLLISSVAAPILGRLGDLYGRKRMILIAIAIAAVGSAISAAHPDPRWIIAGRALQGVSGAVLPLCYGIVREAIPTQRHSVSGGLLIGATSVGAIAGLVIGGFVVDYYNWRTLFWLSALLGVVAAVLAALLLPASKRSEKKAQGLDLLGGLLFVPGAGGLLYFIGKVGSDGSVGVITLGLGAIVIALLVAWVRHELRHPHPLLDVRLLMRREMALTNLVIVQVALGPIQLTLLMMLLLQSSAPGIGLGMTAAAAGAFKIPGNVFSVIASPIAGYLSSKIGERWVMIFGFASNAFAWAFLFIGYNSFWLILFVVILSSTGTTVAFVGVSNQIARIAPMGRVSEALGVNAALRSMAHACGSQIMTLMLGSAAMATGAASAASAADAKSAYFRAFGFVLAVCFLGLATAMALPGRVRRTG